VDREAWYENAFDAFYAELYAHRDESEAERIVAWLARRLGAPGSGGLLGLRALDLACGAGRHLRALARRGVRAVGVDRSRDLLARAAALRRETGSRREELVLGDIRDLPFADRSFGLTISMFTSIGYFATDAENRRVLSEAARVLDPGGHLLIDYLNAEAVVRTLVPASQRQVGEFVVDEKRRIDHRERRIIKEVTVSRQASGERVKHYVESVALWSRDELAAELAATSLLVVDEVGDYDGEAFTAASPRLILLAVRSR
jgi:SAM-dependent methyltransferase